MHFDQLKFANNEDAASSFNLNEIEIILSNLLKSDEKLGEKFQWNN